MQPLFRLKCSKNACPRDCSAFVRLTCLNGLRPRKSPALELSPAPARAISAPVIPTGASPCVPEIPLRAGSVQPPPAARLPHLHSIHRLSAVLLCGWCLVPSPRALFSPCRRRMCPCLRATFTNWLPLNRQGAPPQTQRLTLRLSCVTKWKGTNCFRDPSPMPSAKRSPLAGGMKMTKSWIYMA